MNKEERKFLEIMESQGYTYDENQTGEGIKITFDDGNEYRVTIQEINKVNNEERLHLEETINQLRLIYEGTYRLIYDERSNSWYILYDSELEYIMQVDDQVAHDIYSVIANELNENNIHNYLFLYENKEGLSLTDEEWLKDLYRYKDWE